MPKISVIMPAYNAEDYIAEAIESILSQSFRDFELIILNDCSKDGTENIILSYNDERIVYVKNEENLGVARTLNKGLTLAKGTYIARMDADDISLPERFRLQAAFLDENPAVAVVGSNATVFGEGMQSWVTELPCDSAQIQICMAISNPFVHPSVMMRRAAAMPYEQEFEGREDYRLWMKLSQKYALANLQAPLLRYRQHGKQVTQKKDDKQAQKHFLLKKTYYREIGAGLTEPMMEALCRAAFYKTVTDHRQATDLRSGLEKLAAWIGCPGLPPQYADFLLTTVRRSVTAAAYWKITAGLPLKKRLRCLLRGKG